MRYKSVIIKKIKNNKSNNEAVIHCAINRTRTGFLRHSFTNGDDYRLRVCHYGLVRADILVHQINYQSASDSD